jgi:hypothetical protein
MPSYLTRKHALRQSPATADPHNAPPALDLIKVGDAYAGRAGHHRIPIAGP